MDKWITLLTFKHPTEAHLIKTKLESEGLKVFLKNEFTAQLVPQGSEPASPIKLRIHENDLDNAVKILKANGYLKEENTRFTPSKLIQFIGGVTGKIPGIRNKPLKLRVIFAVAVLLVLITLIFSLLTLPGSVS